MCLTVIVSLLRVLHWVADITGWTCPPPGLVHPQAGLGFQEAGPQLQPLIADLFIEILLMQGFFLFSCCPKDNVIYIPHILKSLGK